MPYHVMNHTMYILHIYNTDDHKLTKMPGVIGLTILMLASLMYEILLLCMDIKQSICI